MARPSRWSASAILLGIFLLPPLASAMPPAWWGDRGVVVKGSAGNDYAPVNQGQLKTVVKGAAAELDDQLPAGAGAELHQLLHVWSHPGPATNDYAPVNLGQAKALTRMIYDRLIQAGYTDHYPWVAAATAANDYGWINIGQLKWLFSFDLHLDQNGNGLADWWERVHGLSLSTTTGGTLGDQDGDGISDVLERQAGTDPAHPDNPQVGLSVMGFISP